MQDLRATLKHAGKSSQDDMDLSFLLEDRKQILKRTRQRSSSDPGSSSALNLPKKPVPSSYNESPSVILKTPAQKTLHRTVSHSRADLRQLIHNSNVRNQAGAAAFSPRVDGVSVFTSKSPASHVYGAGLRARPPSPPVDGTPDRRAMMEIARTLQSESSVASFDADIENCLEMFRKLSSGDNLVVETEEEHSAQRTSLGILRDEDLLLLLSQTSGEEWRVPEELVAGPSGVDSDETLTTTSFLPAEVMLGACAQEPSPIAQSNGLGLQFLPSHMAFADDSNSPHQQRMSNFFDEMHLTLGVLPPQPAHSFLPMVHSSQYVHHHHHQYQLQPQRQLQLQLQPEVQPEVQPQQSPTHSFYTPPFPSAFPRNSSAPDTLTLTSAGLVRVSDGPLSVGDEPMDLNSSSTSTIGSASVAPRRGREPDRGNRGNYHCGRCGQLKVNHVCPFSDAPLTVNKEIQTGPVYLKSTSPWEAAAGERIVSVTRRTG